MAPPKDVQTLVDKLKTQKGIIVEQTILPGANHFFEGQVEPLIDICGAYVDKRLTAITEAA